MKNKLNKQKTKKGQEEMFGFVLIVLILVIIGVILLFFFKPAEPETADYIKSKIDNLLYSMISCDIDEKSMSERIDSCYTTGIGCNELGTIFIDMLNVSLSKTSLTVGKQIKGYSLDVTDTIEVSKGETIGNVLGSSVSISTTSGYVDIRLSFYY